MTAVDLHYQVHGPTDAPPVLLAPSLGTAIPVWDLLAPALADRFRVVRFDLRGHGSSPAPPGPYTVGELATDVLRLADRLDLDRFALVGLSLGGSVAQTLAVERPDRLTALVACCTGPRLGNPADWRARAARVLAEGMGWLVEAAIERCFSPEFAAAHPEEADRVASMLTATSPQGYAACCEALAAYDLTDRLGEVAVPTRVVLGADDSVAPPDLGRRMVAAIPDSDLVVLDDARHLANVGRPKAFNAAVLEHLERHR